MHILLSQILKEKGSFVHSVTPEINALACAKKLTENRIGALVVMGDNKLIGIISERDLVSKVLSQGINAENLTVKDIMTTKLLTVTSEMTVLNAMKIVTEHRCRHLPVVENNQLLGMISIGDLTKAVMLEQEREISDLTDYIQGEIK